MQQPKSNRETAIRQSNIELLRIIAMIIIVAYHFSVHGGFVFNSNTITINRLWIQFIRIGGKTGVDVFVLISGYFLINSNKVITSKVLKFWFQIFTYSIVIFVIFTLSGIVPFDLKELIKHIFPITFTQWWFASTYFVLYLLSPFINKMLLSFDKKQYLSFLLILFFMWCIIPTVTGQAFESNELLWFVFLYSLAGFIKLYGVIDRFKSSTYIILALLVILITWLSAVAFEVLGYKAPIFSVYARIFYDMQGVTILIISVLMLLGFLKLKMGYSKVINVIASATFGVYLVHDNAYIRVFLWKSIFKNATYSESKVLIPYSLMAIVVVYICCTLVELARIYLVEKNYMSIVISISKRIDEYKERFWENH